MIQLDRVTKIYETAKGAVTAADRISLKIPDGEICVLLGPSGCGKTTTMKMVNRLIEPSSGRITINGRDTSELKPVELRRTIGYVIQQIGLFPNKTVLENICVVPDLLGWDRKKSRSRAGELLEMVALDPAHFLHRYPKELSGGQQQRVGVVRALAADPPVMLMDEPFGAIDPINREVIQDEFLRLQKTLRKTIMFVSHDIDEAVKMADKIAIFRDGRLEQFGAPDELLATPANPFVEDFLGSDRALKRLRLVTVRSAMINDYQTLQRDDTVGIARGVLATTEDNTLIMVGPNGRPRGLVRGKELDGAEGVISDVAAPVVATVSVDDDLRNAVALMFAHDMPVLPCVDGNGKLVGLLTYKSVTHALKVSGEMA